MVKRKRNQIVLIKKNQIILGGGESTNPLLQLFSGISNFFFSFTRLFSNFIFSMNPLKWHTLKDLKDKGNQVIGSATEALNKGKEDIGESFNGLKSSVGEKISNVKENIKSVDKKAEDSYNNMGKSDQVGGYRKKTKKVKKRKTTRKKKVQRKKRVDNNNKTIKRRRMSKKR